MSKTAEPTPTDQRAVATMKPRPRAKPLTFWGLVKIILAPVASLRLTVVLFALSLVLIFCGTLAQIDLGIWSVVNAYFRSLYVWIPLQLFFPRDAKVPGSFPFPGGWLLGSLLLVNLLAAHLVRFRLSWKRSGILILHLGLIVMMVSELVTGLFAVESQMTIEANGVSNYVEVHNATELAVVDSSDPKTDDVVAVPASLLRRGLVQNDNLPFDVELVRYMVNSSLLDAPAEGHENPATTGAGLKVVAVERPEGSGVSKEQRLDLASAYVTLKKKGTGESLGTYLVSLWLPMLDMPAERVTVDGKTYSVSLRFKRVYKPYTVQLLEFKHLRYIGTDTPKDFSSRVLLTDPSVNEVRETTIFMNNPFTYRGETFYQQSFLENDAGTILQVVHNPGKWMPYISCAMVALGLLVHFGQHLIGFLLRRGVP
jgi:hypothetical protein